MKYLDKFIKSLAGELSILSLIIFLTSLMLNYYLAHLYLFLRIAYNDFKAYDIYLTDVLLLFFLLLYKYQLNFDPLNIILIIGLYLASKLKYLGLGDIWLIFIISLFFNAFKLNILIMIATLFALIYSLIKRTKVIAFGPFIYLALLIFLFLE